MVSSWKARLSLGFRSGERRTVLAERSHDGPLVVQKPLYPEGEAVCHAIVVHPPGGIAGGDELNLDVRARESASALLTTPGAAKWYRSAGAWAKQSLAFGVAGSARMAAAGDHRVRRRAGAGRVRGGPRAPARAASAGTSSASGAPARASGSGAAATAARSRIRREGRLLWLERGRIDGGGRLLESPAGLGGSPVFGTLFASSLNLDQELLNETRKPEPEAGRGAVTLLARHPAGALPRRFERGGAALLHRAVAHPAPRAHRTAKPSNRGSGRHDERYREPGAGPCHAQARQRRPSPRRPACW